MSLLCCNTPGCGSHIDTGNAPREGVRYKCGNCGKWTLDTSPNAAETVQLEAAYRQTTRYQAPCPFCGRTLEAVVGPAGQYSIGQLADGFVECLCTHDQVVDHITQRGRRLMPDGRMELVEVPREVVVTVRNRVPLHAIVNHPNVRRLPFEPMPEGAGFIRG